MSQSTKTVLPSTIEKQMSTLNERYSVRTVKLIERGRRILLKKADGAYLHQWTNIAAGPDECHWTSLPSLALEIFNLQWAFAIAPLYKCKVYSVKL